MAGSLLTTSATSLMSLMISWRSDSSRPLCRRRFHARHPVALRLVLDRVIERHGLQDIEQLPLVFVDALDRTSNSAPGSTLMLRRSPISRASAILLWCLTLRKLLLECIVAGTGFKTLKLRGIVEHGLAAGLAQQVCHFGLASISQRGK